MKVKGVFAGSETMLNIRCRIRSPQILGRCRFDAAISTSNESRRALVVMKGGGTTLLNRRTWQIVFPEVEAMVL
jgi:hypothetical protein